MPAPDFSERAASWQLRASGHRIAGWRRGYEEISATRWPVAENEMLQLFTDLAFAAYESPLEPEAEPAEVAQVLARALADREAGPGVEADTAYGVLAALAFAMTGNFASAQVAASQLVEQRPLDSPIEEWVVGALESGAPDASVPPAFAEYAGALVYALGDGSDSTMARATSLLEASLAALASTCSGLDATLLLAWRAVHHQMLRHSAARVMRAVDGMPAAYVARLIDSSVRLLFPSQRRAIEEDGLLQTERNALVVLPTSSGKSLLAEMSLVRALREDAPLGIYLAPYRELADQVRAGMVNRVEAAGVRCVVRRGGYLETTGPIDLERPTIVVATPEALDCLARSNESILRRCACLVFDEFHLVEQAPRGLTYEGLATRALRLRQAGMGPRIIALAPTLSNTERVERWLGDGATLVVRGGWQPAGKVIGLASARGVLDVYEMPRSAGPSASVIPVCTGSLPVPNPGIEPPAVDDYQGRRDYDVSQEENVAAIAWDQYRRHGAPVLVLAGTRTKARRLSARVARYADELADPRLEQLADELRARAPDSATLQRTLTQGVAYHTAGLPGWVRSEVVRLIRAGALRVVCATTTLAEGVDLPFRVVVMASPQQYRYGWRMVSPLFFRNLAGRCGRAGKFLEGDTIIVDRANSAADGNAALRHADYLRRYVAPRDVALETSVEFAARTEEPELLRDVRSGLESQFMAFLPLVGEREDQVGLFASELLSGGDPRARALASSVAEQLIEDCIAAPAPQLIVRHSPARLTSFGEAALSTGLSPRSLGRLVAVIESFTPGPDSGTGSRVRRREGAAWRPLAAALLKESVGSDAIAEVRRALFEIGRPGFPVRAQDLVTAGLLWAAGAPVVDILAACTTGRQLLARTAYERWRDAPNSSAGPDLEDACERLGAFCSSALAESMSWILRSVAVLAAAMNLPEVSGMASRDAEAMRWGVPTTAGADLLKAGCPVDRASVACLVGMFERRPPGGATDLPTWLVTTEGLEGQQVGRSGRISIARRDIDLLSQWIARGDAPTR